MAVKVPIGKPPPTGIRSLDKWLGQLAGLVVQADISGEDHGELDGLGDNDHNQYALRDGTNITGIAAGDVTLIAYDGVEMAAASLGLGLTASGATFSVDESIDYDWTGVHGFSGSTAPVRIKDGGGVRFFESNAFGSDYTHLSASESVSASYSIALPDAAPTNPDMVLKNSTAGGSPEAPLEWVDGQVQIAGKVVKLGGSTTLATSDLSDMGSVGEVGNIVRMYDGSLYTTVLFDPNHFSADIAGADTQIALLGKAAVASGETLDYLQSLFTGSTTISVTTTGSPLQIKVDTDPDGFFADSSFWCMVDPYAWVASAATTTPSFSLTAASPEDTGGFFSPHGYVKMTAGEDTGIAFRFTVPKDMDLNSDADLTLIFRPVFDASPGNLRMQLRARTVPDGNALSGGTTFSDDVTIDANNNTIQYSTVTGFFPAGDLARGDVIWGSVTRLSASSVLDTHSNDVRYYGVRLDYTEEIET